MQPDVFADAVVVLVKNALTPVFERLAATEARLAMLGDLRDRVVMVETKSIMATAPATVDLTPVLERLSVVELRQEMKAAETVPLLSAVADLTKDLGGLRERVAVVEVRPSLPGPQGEQGSPGKDGTDGKDGAAGLEFVGVYQEGKSYDVGQLATFGGSSWHCNAPTTTKPGDGSKDWTLMVKRGRDGRDGHDAVTVPVVSVGRP